MKKIFLKNTYFSNMLSHEVIIFIIVGIINVSLDFINYYLLTYLFLLNYNVAKTVSCIISIFFSYFANKRFTFNYNNTNYINVIKFIVVYTFALIVNVLGNHICYTLLDAYAYAMSLSFVIATLCAAMCSFLGMKFIVFKK